MAPPNYTTNTNMTTIPDNVTSIGAHITPPDTLRLTLALQTTLELEEVVGIFSREAQEDVRHDGCIYRSPGEPFEVTIGRRAIHQAQYDLTLAGEALGNIAFSRGSRFTEHEMLRLEYLLCALVYPLRNALRYRQLALAASRDPLTGLGNRASLEESVAREIELAQRHGFPLSLLAIDLDHFKRINDSYGHSIGDVVLKATAELMRQATRASDQLFRYGGEEFVALLTQTGIESARLVAERIRSAIATKMADGREIPLPVTVSVGVAVHEKGDRCRCLFDKADHALYEAKRNGRNRIEVYGTRG